MQQRKFQVFISSTFTDLIEERQIAVEAILSAGHIPAGMELFKAGDESQMTVIKRWIDESDIYLLLLGGRYGSVEELSGKSYTQLEYEYAKNQNKPLFVLVMSETALEIKLQKLGSKGIERENGKKLKEFYDVVTKNLLVHFWNDVKDIKLSVFQALSDFNYRTEIIGWIRGDNSINSSLVVEEIAKLTRENSILREQILNNSPAFFGNLSFEQLDALLKKETISHNNNEISLYTFIKIVANKLLKNEIVTDDTKKGMDRLIMFKMAKQLSTDGVRGTYTFSEEGHNFYITARFRAKEI